jgi:hypothetical protein
MIGTRFYGRMGNVLFQAAHCIAFALKNNEEFSMPNRTTDPYWNPLYLSHLVDSKYIQGKEDVLINESAHEWQPVEYKEEWKGLQVVLNGYWQTEKYFKEYRSEIIAFFDFKWEKRDYISIHVRRGDYVHLVDKHPPFSPEYYRAATSYFYNKGFDKFRVFSDDIPFCRDYFSNDPHYSAFTIEYSANSNEVDDLVDMSCGAGNICSSSTFAWWGMWLNRNKEKIVIFPKLWFVEGYHLKTHDVVPEWCTKL